MPYNYISLNGNCYIIRTIKLKNEETVTISTTDLDDSLFDNNGQYISDDSKHIDEMIFYFVNKDEIKLPEKLLSELVYQEALS